MNSRKLLTLFLALCLTISVISPAVSAVQAGSESSVSQGESVSSGSNRLDSLIASGNGSTGSDTLRDEISDKNMDISLVDGQWIATSVDGISVELTDAELPEHIQALRKAAEYYAASDRVAAFVVLEEDPTVEQYSSIDEVPDAETEYLSEQQDALISAIEEEVLEGEELSVITQFTYLTNSVVVETEFGNLETIASLDGVKSVFLSPVYEACEASSVTYPATVSAGNMSGVGTVWEDLKYTGAGITIAVLDTGLDLDHPSFEAAPQLTESSWTAEWLQGKLDELDLKCEELYKDTLTAADLYYSAKVPFIFNYALGTTNVSHNDGLGDHGTHVAGIAAANDVEGSGVVGMAPDAQIVVMKVFNSQTGGSNMYDLVKALEDCMSLGVDVVNMSLGSPAGFSESGDEEIDNIFARISNTDMIVDVAAGNEGTSAFGSLYGNYMNTTENIDNATISSPSTYANSMSIASVNNNLVFTPYFTLADGSKVFYMQAAEYLYEYIDFSLEILADQELEYVIIDGLGEAENFYDADGNSLVAGKVAVVKRGELSFADKALNAQDAGAVAVLIWDNVSEDIFSFGMSVAAYDEEGNEYYPDIPVVLISQEDGNKLAEAEDKTLVPAAETAARKDSSGGQVSSFSSWGVAPDLSLLPDITGVGGNVYSCYDGGEYGLMSGTSMATPQVAGVTALVLQYLHEKFPNATVEEIRTLVDSLMMSTAVPVVDSTTNLEASPRQQGAGLVNAFAAITAEAYLSVNGSERPKAELGASENGEYTFTFTVHNFGANAKTYTLSSSLLCEDYAEDEEYPNVYFMAESEHALDNDAVSFDKTSVTVSAGETAEVTVTIKLTDADKEWINTYFPSGNYVEGFVYLTAENEVTLSLPFLGFYGDWAEAPIFDTGYWYDNGFWDGMNEDLVWDEVEANQYYHALFTSLGTSSTDWVLGFNPYTGVTVDENGDVIYSEKNNVLSPNGDGIQDGITNMYLSLMRNAKYLKLTYTDAEGNVLYKEELDRISKTMYNSNYGMTLPFVYSWYYENLYDFTDDNGSYLPDGTELTLTISAALAYGDEEYDDVMLAIPIIIDTAAPVLDVDHIIESTVEGKNYLTLTVEEEHPAYVVVMNNRGTQVYATYPETVMVENEDGTYTITLDVTGLGDSFTVALCDYGSNEAYYELTWSESGANDPEADPSALYAYQIRDAYIAYYYGEDYMYGWSTIDKEEPSNVQMLQSDAYEYYALTAAEYAGGYVFAVDAGHNFYYMVPGLWDRQEICNLGINVIDMAFDESTGIMYLATTDRDNGSYCLYTVDLLTGELTQLWDYYSQYDMPWTMTFVDGKLYCCKNYSAGFYQVDLESGTYELLPVTLEDGTEFSPKTSAGSNVSPYYSQSMTYSKADGKIYWAYCSWGDDYDLITIDPSNWSYSVESFGYEREYVGLLTVEDDGYTLPESSEVTKLIIDEEQIIMGTGGTYALTATALPWNAPADKKVVEWSSSNESVATVDANGVVTALTEGIATITATCGDLEVTCQVIVVNIEGNVNAYKYYDGNYDYGYWLDIDLAGATEEKTVDSPVDFIAADYNGHNGKVYGYDEYGQCYWFDPETGDFGTLGTANTSLIPADMAYDYSSGIMCVAVYDANAWNTTLYALNMNTGKLVNMATAYDIYLTLACSTEGQLYAINYLGELYELYLMPGSDDGMGGGGGIMPLDDDDYLDDDFGFGGDTTEGSETYIIYPNYIMQTPVDSVSYTQTMCYDHNNDVLLWINPETSSVYWIGGLTDYNLYAVSLGDPSGTGWIVYTGAYVVPNDIQDLPFVAVTSVEADDMMMLTGSTVAPNINVYPVNASHPVIYDVYTIDNSNNVVTIGEDGSITAVGAGSITVCVDWFDMGENGVDDGTEPLYTTTFTVTVKDPTDNIYGYLASDIASYDGGYWIGIDDADTTNYQPIDYVYYNDLFLTLYSAEYVDGTIYAYGYNADDWNANFLFLTIDAATWTVTSATDMGDGFPFVYDMAFDYTTGTMYALAGPSDNATDLYYVDMTDGKLIECMLTDPMFMSLAIDANGTIYAMATSEEDPDMGTWSNALLYTLDPAAGTYEVFMDTGVRSNMLASMAYDYDTGYLYWTGLYQGYSYESALYLIDPADKTCNSLGIIGSAGAQVTGLMIIADNYPEIPEDLYDVAMANPLAEVAVGKTTQLEAFLQPYGVDVQISWSSADESIATVDENGVVTGVAPGVTTVTVTVTDGNKTATATAKVVIYGEDDYFITYNYTDGGFSAIARPDPSVVTNLTEGEEASPVTAMAMVNGYIFAYDEENNLFVTTVADGFQRTYLGDAGIEVEESYSTSTGTKTVDCEYTFVVRDMAWDEANHRLLALACYGMNKTVTYFYDDGSTYSYTDILELDGGCRIYEVDITTGALTELCVVGGEDAYESGVTMLTVTNDGKAYAYSLFMDYVMELDLETGAVKYLTTFQNQGVYGSSDGDLMAMTYDEATESLFMLFTANGRIYSQYKFNPANGAITLVENIGEVTKSGYYYTGDCFAGLVVNEEHTCEYDVTDSKAATCTADGYTTYTCPLCGDSYTETVKATGHSYEVTDSKAATCTADGHTTYTCSKCGDSYTETVKATGHTYVDGKCACGAAEPDPELPASGDSFNRVVMALVPMSLMAVAMVVLNRKKFLNA